MVPCLRYVCAFVLMAVAMPAGAASRLSFERVVPARQDLHGAEDLLITYAIADNEKVSTFLDTFVEQANRAGTLRVTDVTRIEHSTERSHRWRRAPRYLEQRTPADAFLRVEVFTCTATAKTGEGRAYDVDGNRVPRTVRWFDAVCQAHIDVIAKKSSGKIAELNVRGEGTSTRVEGALSEGERDTALEQAARFAAIAAAEEITPRRVRETIELVESAPEFARGMAEVDADNFDQARRLWEDAVTRHPGSAALEF